ncbi:asparagine synthase-related protein [Brevundimonas nasdae]|uniref:Asparagine synthetase domain-containing protein n=1 Tax=Brevundimonas nasdae TaxID=172043 RepID=A0ABX8TKY1_9CAUL|nr:asparagine synthase-related protein [Brevundimonas nasdae]QYC11448.1 hypothetical protein KWG56_05590 [Brevundimonas nasdae]
MRRPRPDLLVIGEWRPSGAEIAQVVEGAESGKACAEHLVRHGWGRYVAVHRDSTGDVSVLRDPTGSLDCAVWRSDPLRFIADDLPDVADSLLPAGLRIDWSSIADYVAAPERVVSQLALTDIETVHPGCLARLTRSGLEQALIWDPAAFYDRRGSISAGTDLLETVRGVVDALASDHDRFVTEISGGFDSAVVAGLLAGGPRDRLIAACNFHGRWPEGDERTYAHAVAERHHLDLNCIEKPVQPIRLEDFASLGAGLRPAMQAVDATYDAALADRMVRDGATASFTGQGGDAVFYQAAFPDLAADRRDRLGLMGLSPRFLSDTAQWTRRSAWAVARIGLRPHRAEIQSTSRHPWLAASAALPPGKRRQIRQLANAQIYWGDCRRARVGALLHPFLSQPVMEHCIALPADVLAAGGQDRAFARAAFAAILPDIVRQRRNKGDLTRHYGEINRLSLPLLRPLLIEGLLARNGVLDAARLEAELTPERLVWDGDYGRVVLLALLEVWAQAWVDRLGRRHA